MTWNIRRRVDPNAFGPRRVTVQFEFSNVPRAKRYWWIVNDRGAVDLCPSDPGFPVDLYITTDMRTMVHVWVGKLSLAAAIRPAASKSSGRAACATAWASGFSTARST